MKYFIFSLITIVFLFSCKRKGCKDHKALNYNDDEKVVSEPSQCIEIDEFKGKIIRGGSLDWGAVWEKIEGADVDYYVIENLTLRSGMTLRIMPGVVVEFAPRMGINLDGKLICQGTASNRIVFRSTGDEYFWRGIDNSLNLYQNETDLQYVDIINANTSHNNSTGEYMIKCKAGGNGIINLQNVNFINNSNLIIECGLKFNDSQQQALQSSISGVTTFGVTNGICQ